MYIDTMDISSKFVEEIDFTELHVLEVVGRGAFGVVNRARWRNTDVAVKLIETESERKAFITELKQLSRICHPNIVKLYGACTRQPVCLIMEFAEGGSLYTVLHGCASYPVYTAAHAVSWTLQCARGVEYLHAMKPKPLIHRDLKPPNLLLVNNGTVVKICDFGTACDAHTHMTNNKGSAAWMAPEVFEGCNYSEKCDVFSWGIILWEVITRQKPFEEIGGSAFRVMWAMHSGKRPALVKDCPKSLETLMTRCWSANPVERPSMSEIVRLMTRLSQFFPGVDEPLIYANRIYTSPDMEDSSLSSIDYTSPQCSTRANTVHSDTLRHMHNQSSGELFSIQRNSTPPKPVVIEDASSSRRASRDSLTDVGARSAPECADVTHGGDAAGPTPVPPVRRHKRTGSHGAAPVSTVPQPFVPGHRRTGSHGNNVITTSADYWPPDTTLPTVITAPGNLEDVSMLTPNNIGSAAARSVSWTPGGGRVSGTDSLEDIRENNVDLQNLLEPQCRPLPPCPTSPESVSIYTRHCSLVEDFVRIQAKISRYEQHKQQLTSELQLDEQERHNRLKEEYYSLLTENDELKLLHSNLLKQAEQLNLINVGLQQS